MADPWELGATVAQIVAGAAAIAALAFAYFAIRASRDTIEEMRRQFEESHQPYVILDGDVSEPPMVYLVIRNAGDAAARNVKIDFEPNFDYHGGKSIRDLAIFSRLHYLPPGKEIRFFLDSTIGMEERRPTRFVTKISFESTTGRKFAYEIPVDLESYFDLLHTRRHRMHDLVEKVSDLNGHLRKIANEVEKLSGRFEEGLRIRGMGERRSNLPPQVRILQRTAELRTLLDEYPEKDEYAFHGEKGRELFARIQMIEEDLLSACGDSALTKATRNAIVVCAKEIGNLARTDYWRREAFSEALTSTRNAVEQLEKQLESSS